MDRNGLLPVIIVFFFFFFFFLVADCSTATQSSPDSGGKVTNPIPVDPANNSSVVNPKVSKDENNNTAAPVTVSSPVVNQKEEEKKSQQGKDKLLDDQTKSQSETNATCDGLPWRCRDHKALVTCFPGSNDLVLVVQNEGESTLKVKIVANATMEQEIPKLQYQRINNISFIAGQDIKIVLNSSGDGNCVLHMDPSVSEGNLFKRLAAFYKPVIPMYTEYFLFLMVIITGGTWGFFKFRKRRRVESGVAYQELEMGLPEASASASAVGASDTAEGWDQGWDDDWDEENAVKSPGGLHVSVNGLPSRSSSNRDGWEDNWDD